MRELSGESPLGTFLGEGDIATRLPSTVKCSISLAMAALQKQGCCLETWHQNRKRTVQAPSPLEDSSHSEVFLVVVIVGGEPSTTALKIGGSQTSKVSRCHLRKQACKKEGISCARDSFPEEAVLQNDLG